MIIPEQGESFALIGTGGVSGVYYPTGGVISRLVNETEDDHNIKLAVVSTGGSVANINSVLNGDLIFGIAQSDRQHEAYYGLAEWEKAGQQENLRSVFSIYTEAVTLVATVDSDIKSVYDLKGKRVNLGNVGSGQLQNALTVLDIYGLAETDIKAENLKLVDALRLLNEGELDAFFYTVGHPNTAMEEATSGRLAVRIIPLDGYGIDKLVQDNAYYSKTGIPKHLYPYSANEADVPTFGVKATLVTTEEAPEDLIYSMTKEVFENLDTFKTFHPAYAEITPKSMLEGLSAPFHPGAIRYYREVGLLDSN